MKWIILTLSLAFVIIVNTIVITKSVSLEQNCTGYLKRAADANTIETAKQELQKSLTFLQENNITNGYTSVLWRTPDEDIGFWYKNLKSSEAELAKVDSTTSQMEKTNILMKLRETLLDNKESGDNITVPSGLSTFPNNGLWCILQWISIFVIIALIIWWLTELEY